jgi:hypothetical protein
MSAGNDATPKACVQQSTQELDFQEIYGVFHGAPANGHHAWPNLTI